MGVQTDWRDPKGNSKSRYKIGLEVLETIIEKWEQKWDKRRLEIQTGRNQQKMETIAIEDGRASASPEKGIGWISSNSNPKSILRLVIGFLKEASDLEPCLRRDKG